MTARWIFTWACVGWLSATPATAQEPLDLTVDEAVTRALAQAPRIAEAMAREAAAGATVAARQAQALPTIVASTGILRTNRVPEFGLPQADGRIRVIFPDIPNNYQARAQLNVPLFTSGRIGDLVAAATADVRAASADRRTTTADLRMETAVAYWTLVMTREGVGVLDRALERADASLADARARVESGLVPPNELLSAQAQRARQQVLQIQAQNAAALAEAQLARLVGAPVGQSIRTRTPVGQATPDATALAATAAETLVRRALDSRPERLALTERQAALRASGDAALAASRPQIAASASVEPARPNQRFVPRVDQWNTSWDVGVNVSWALWDGGRARAERAAAMAQAEALRHRTEDFDALVSVEVRQRLLDLSAARAALGAAGEAVLAAAEARRVVNERFLAGVITNTDVLDADVAWLESELEQTRLAATLRIAEARLLRTVGEP